MKKVLITGGAGFLGQAVARQFRDTYSVSIASRKVGGYDLLDLNHAEDMFECKPDVVVHLAASVGGIGANRENPGKFFYDNMLMGMNVIDAASRYMYNKKDFKLVLIGTICSYPKNPSVPFKESDLWNGFPEETNAPYGIAKKSLIVMAQAYRQQYGLNTVCLLPTNLYGPGDNFKPESSHVIPALIKKFVDAKRDGSPFVEVWGTGAATREFLYVDDAADAIFKATNIYNGSEPVNIGSGEEVSILNLANLICALVGYDGDIVWNSNQPDGQPRRCLDTSRALEEFGFKAETSLRRGLETTIKWYLENK